MNYIIKSKDTLNKIATKYRVSVSDILKVNPGIKNRNTIKIGQVLKIPEIEFKRPTFGGGYRPTVMGMNTYLFNYGQSILANYNFLQCSIYDVVEENSLTNSSPAEIKTPPWMKTAKAEIGVKEMLGKHNANPRILEYFKASKYWGKDDSGAKNAWCGSFVAWVMQQNNIPPVNKAYRAKEWMNFGKKIETPIYGAIGIKSRKGGGHVAFIVGKSKDGSKYYMLGGNQKDQVQILEYQKNVWDAFVVPLNYDESQGDLPVYDIDQTEKSGKES